MVGSSTIGPELSVGPTIVKRLVQDIVRQTYTSALSTSSTSSSGPSRQTTPAASASAQATPAAPASPAATATHATAPAAAAPAAPAAVRTVLTRGYVSAMATMPSLKPLLAEIAEIAEIAKTARAPPPPSPSTQRSWRSSVPAATSAIKITSAAAHVRRRRRRRPGSDRRASGGVGGVRGGDGCGHPRGAPTDLRTDLSLSAIAAGIIEAARPLMEVEADDQVPVTCTLLSTHAARVAFDEVVLFVKLKILLFNIYYSKFTNQNLLLKM